MIIFTHDLATSFEHLVRQASVTRWYRAADAIAIAAIAYTAQLAIDLGGYDAKVVREIEQALIAKVRE